MANPVATFFRWVGTKIAEAWAAANTLERINMVLSVVTLAVGVKGFMQARQMLAKGQDILANKTSAGGKIPVIYGTRRVGAQVVYMDVSNNDSRHLFVVYALSVGEVDEILGKTIQLDGNPLTDSARFKYGSYIGSDKISSGSGSLNTVSQVGSTISAGAGGFGTSPTSRYRITFNLHHGAATQTADPMLVASMPNWTSAHKLNGIAYIAAHYKYDKEGMFAGVPQLTVQVRGKKVYDPRDSGQTFGTVSTYEYSSNPALCFLDFITNNEYGKGLTESQINMSTFSSAANVCDTEVDNPFFGGTSKSLTWSGNSGDGFITIGGSDPNSDWWQNKIGELIDIYDNNGDGVITGKEITDIQRDEFFDQNPLYRVYFNDTLGTNYSSQTTGSSLVKIKRFHCNGYLDTNKNVMDNAKELLANMRGIFLYIDGKYELQIEDTGSSSFTITDDHIIADAGISVDYGNKDKKANKVIVEFFNANKRYELDTATVLHDATPEYYSDDNDEILEIKAEFPYVTDPYIAYNMAKAILVRSRKQMTIQFLGTPEMYKLNVGDIVTLNYVGTFDTSQTCRVEALELQPNGLVAVSLIEYFDVYTWETPPEEPLEELANLPSAYAVKAPTGLTFTDSDSSSTDRPILSWTAPTDYPDYEFRVNVVDSSGNQLINRIVNTTEAELNFTPTGSNYVASVTSLNTLGTESDASTLTFSVSTAPVGLGDIRADSVTANTIDVDELSAISADMGSITAGSMNIGSGNFTVSSSGVMTATGATISGALTATSLNVTNATVTGTLDASTITLNGDPLDDLFGVAGSGSGKTLSIGHDTKNQLKVDGTQMIYTAYDSLQSDGDDALIMNHGTATFYSGSQSTGWHTTTIYAGDTSTAGGILTDRITVDATATGLNSSYQFYVNGEAFFDDPITLDTVSAPSTTTNKLYNVGGTLYWNGNSVNTGAGDITGVTITTTGGSLTGGAAYTSGDATFTLDIGSTITGAKTFDNNVVIQGNLDVQGTTTTIDTTNLDVKDKNITLNYGTGDTSANANGAGITIQDAVSAGNDATLTWDTSNDTFNFSHDVIIGATDAGNKTLTISGGATGNAEGGEIRLATAADYDTTYDFYRIDVIQDSFRIGRAGTTDLTINSSGNATFAGNVTATAFYGDGSNLTGVTSTTINNNADNRIITGSGTANTLNAESTLTYDGTTLKNDRANGSGSVVGIQLTAGSSIGDNISLDFGSTTANAFSLQYDHYQDRLNLLDAGSNVFYVSGGVVTFTTAPTFGGGLTVPSLTVTGNGTIQTGAAGLIKGGYYQVGSTTVIDTSRNLTNIGTISSGAITSSGNLHAGDGTNISMDASANGQLEVDGNGYQGAIALDGSAMHVYHNSSSRDLVLGTNETARLTIGGTGGFNFHSNNLTSVGTISSGSITVDPSGTYGDGITINAGDNNTASQSAKQIIMSFGGTSSIDYPHSIRTRHNSGSDTGNTVEIYLWDYATDSSSTIGSKRALVLENSTGLDLLTGGYRVGGTTVIDSSRNLTNIGNITLSGTVTPPSNQFHVFNKPSNSGYQTVARFGSASGGIYITTDSSIISSGAYYNNAWYLTDSTATLLNFDGGSFGFETASGTSGNTASFASTAVINSSGIDSKLNGFLINGTRVIDSSRNLINIGSITSTGAITLNGTLGTWSVDNQGAIMNFTRATANYIKAGSTGGYLVFQTNGANAALTLNAQQNATFAGNVAVNAGSSYPLQVSSTQRYQLQIRNANNTTNSGYGWWMAHDTNFNFVLHADGLGDKFTLTKDGDAAFTGAVTLETGGLILGEDAYSASSQYVGMKSALMTGSSDYMIISAQSTAGDNGHTYVSAKDGQTVHIRGGGNNSNNQIRVPDDSYISMDTSSLRFTGALAQGTTTVIDSSRNLTNIGTISSGAITTSGTIINNQGSPTGTVIGGVRSYGTSGAYMGASDESGRTAFFGVDSSGYAMFGALTNHDTVLRANNSEKLRVKTNGNVQITSGNLQMGTTTVIDSSRNLTNIGTATLVSGTKNDSSISVNKNFGYGFHNDSAGTGAYAIIREPGAWSSPYPDIYIKAHTGLSMGANSGYEGVRIFTDYNETTRVIQFNGTSNYIFKDVWMHTDGGEGIYSGTNGAHIDPNTAGTYGAWRILGSRNSYGGFYDGNSGNNIGMYDSAGNGGDYDGSHRWITYYHVGNACLGVMGSSTSSSYGLYEQGGGIYSTGNITAYSDRRVKENIVSIDNALKKVNALQGVYYNRIDDEEKKKEIGFIAQDVNEVTPELVTYAEDVDQYGVKYGNTTALLVEAIKELTQKVKELEKKLEEK